MIKRILISILSIIMVLSMTGCSLVTDKFVEKATEKAVEEHDKIITEDFGTFTAEIRKGWQKQENNGFDLYVARDNIGYYYYDDTTISDYYFQYSIKKGPDVYVKFFTEHIRDIVVDEISDDFVSEVTLDGNMYDTGYAIVHNDIDNYSYVYFLINPIKNEIYTFIAIYDSVDKKETAEREVKRLALSMKIKEESDVAEREHI